MALYILIVWNVINTILWLLYCRNILESTWNRNAEEEAAFIQYYLHLQYLR